MKAAYVDTSCILAVYFEEPGHHLVLEAMSEYDEILSSNLLEAELRAAMRREGFENPGLELLKRFIWVLPSRPLSREIESVLLTGSRRE